jgi:hypothetical protein
MSRCRIYKSGAHAMDSSFDSVGKGCYKAAEHFVRICGNSNGGKPLTFPLAFTDDATKSNFFITHHQATYPDINIRALTVG